MSSSALSARRRLIAVLCGGFLGTLARYLLSGAIQAELGKGWPYDILFINLTGAFLLAFMTPLADATLLIGPTRRLFLTVGFVGAYTTFSSLELGDVLFFTVDRWIAAILYMVVSVIGGGLFVLLGNWLGQWCISKTSRSTQRSKTTPRLTGMLSGLPPESITGDDQLERQDKPLLPDLSNERETRQRPS
jgi:fluoride exporter